MEDLMKKEEHPAEDILIVPLKEGLYNDLLNKFECQIEELKAFLIEDARKQQGEALNKTYLWISKKDNVLLGYITLCADSIRLKEEERAKMVKLGILYKSFPAMKIGRWAVHKNYVRKGIGTKMYAFAVNLVLKINKVMGCRYLTLEAKNSENIPNEIRPVRFYKNKLEFVILKDKGNLVYLYKDLKPIINATTGF